MSDQKNRPENPDLDDIAPDGLSDDELEGVSLDDFPDSAADFPADFSEDFPGDGGGFPEATDDDGDDDPFGDLEDSPSADAGEEDPFGDDASDEEGDSFEESADWPDEDSASEEDLEDSGEEGQFDDDDTAYDGEVTEYEEPASFAQKIKKQAIPLAAGAACLLVLGGAGLQLAGPLLSSGSQPQQTHQQPNAAPSVPRGPAEAPEEQHSAPPQQQANQNEPVAPEGLPTQPADPAADNQEVPDELGDLSDIDTSDLQPPQANSPVESLEGQETLPGPVDEAAPPQMPGIPAAESVSQEPVAQEPPAAGQATQPAPEISDDFVSRNDLSEVVREAFEQVVETQFNSMFDRLDGLSDDVMAVSKNVSVISERIEEIDTSLVTVRAQVSDMDSRLADYMNKVDELEKLISEQGEPEQEVSASEAPVEASPAPTIPESEAVSTPAPKSEPEAESQTAQQEAPSQPSRPLRGGDVDLPSKPMVVDGYALKGVSRGMAWIDTGYGIIQVGVGHSIDGVGKVQRIAQGQGNWMVVTDAGLILP